MTVISERSLHRANDNNHRSSDINILAVKVAICSAKPNLTTQIYYTLSMNKSLSLQNKK